MPLLLGMKYKVACVVRVQRHHDVEEVGPVNLPTLRKFVREVSTELRILNHLRIEVLDWQFIIHGNIDPFNILHSEESLLFCENLLQKVFVQANVWWTVELTK
jgi:hypothetical protein